MHSYPLKPHDYISTCLADWRAFSVSSQVASTSRVKEGSCLDLVSVIMSPVYRLEPMRLDFSWGKNPHRAGGFTSKHPPSYLHKLGIRLGLCVTVVPLFRWLTCLFGVCLAEF